MILKVSDGKGREAKLTMWGHPGDDVSGMISRSEKVAGTCEKVIKFSKFFIFGTNTFVKDNLNNIQVDHHILK